MKKILCALIVLTAIAAAQNSKESESQTIATSGSAVTFFDGRGTVSNSWEEVISGAPSTVSIVIQGCMRGGTCSTLDTNTGTSSATRTTSGYFDNYVVTATFTGGTSPAVQINRTGTLARVPSSGGGGTPGGSSGNLQINNAGAFGPLSGNTSCSVGQTARGIDVNGNATGCTVAGAGTVTHTAGALTLNQLVFGNAAADLAVGDLTGDITTGGGKATTLAAVGTAGSCGDATHSCQLTFDTKGRETAQANVAITGGTGTVTSFSAGDLAPIFTSSVATATTTPAHTFTLTNAAANTSFGNFTGGSAAPTYTATTGTGTPVSGTSPSLTTPSVAGMTLSSGQIAVPSTTCTTPSYSETGNLAVGISMNATVITFCPGGLVAGLKSTGYIGDTNSVLGFSTSSANITTFGTGFSPSSQTAAGVMALGNGSVQDESGLLRSGNPCRITAVINLTTAGGSQTICSWSLFASAKTWAWQCSGTYSISSGTTPAFGLGMNASQTPTSETGNASINTTLSGTNTQSSTTATASGNQSILTGGTLTTITNAPWSTSGTIQASATAGTFAITGIVTGTTAVGTVNVGSTCLLY